MELDPDVAKAAAFYDERYAGTQPFFLKPGTKLALGDPQNRLCRFCGLGEPNATFKLEAHAIPEALGNKSLTTNYECDQCNHLFGSGIENDLGNWSKPTRTFARIRGKSGVPTLKKGGPNPGWRIEYGSTGLHITQYGDDPILEVDEEKKIITFHLKRDAYTPVAVLKAFVKIGLTLMPANEMPNFEEALAWIRDKDHSRGLVNEFPLIRTFQQGPMPNDLIFAMLMRRRYGVTGMPYAFLVLSFGNEVFQVFLPTPKQDAQIDRQKLTFPAFPTPDGPDPTKYGKPSVKLVDLTGREIVRGERNPITLRFDQMTMIDASKPGEQHER